MHPITRCDANPMHDDQTYPNHPTLTDRQPLKVPLTFLHEASPEGALRILRTGEFRGDWMLNDAGLNGELPDRTLSGQADRCGAILTFEWTGLIVQMPKELETWAQARYAPDTLYDERPNRVFVPAGTTRHLRLVGLTLREEASWAQLVTDPPRPGGRQLLDPGAWFDWCKPEQWRARQLAALVAEVAAVAHHRLAIRVVRASHAALDERTPDALSP